MDRPSHLMLSNYCWHSKPLPSKGSHSNISDVHFLIFVLKKKKPAIILCAFKWMYCVLTLTLLLFLIISTRLTRSVCVPERRPAAASNTRCAVTQCPPYLTSPGVVHLVKGTREPSGTAGGRTSWYGRSGEPSGRTRGHIPVMPLMMGHVSWRNLLQGRLWNPRTWEGQLCAGNWSVQLMRNNW